MTHPYALRNPCSASPPAATSTTSSFYGHKPSGTPRSCPLACAVRLATSGTPAERRTCHPLLTGQALPTSLWLGGKRGWRGCFTPKCPTGGRELSMRSCAGGGLGATLTFLSFVRGRSDTRCYPPLRDMPFPHLLSLFRRRYLDEIIFSSVCRCMSGVIVSLHVSVHMSVCVKVMSLFRVSVVS